MYLKSTYIHSTCHAYIKLSVVSTAAGLGALLHIFSVAPLLEGLPGHILLNVLTLLPGGGDVAANLVRDIIADLTWGGDVIADLGYQKMKI